MSGSVTAFYGAVVTPVDNRLWKALPRCLLVVGPTGNIECMIDHVERNELAEELIRAGYPTAERVILPEGKFIIPGFIDTHTHAVQFPTSGKGGEYVLMDWLNNVIFPGEARFENTDFAWEVYGEVIRRSLDCGTTTSCYYGSLHLEATKILADFANELGQRAFIGKCNMDRNPPDDKEEESVDKEEERVDNNVESVHNNVESVHNNVESGDDKAESGDNKEDNVDYVEESADKSVEATKKLIDYIRRLQPKSEHVRIGTAPEPLVQVILTPRFALSCTNELLERVADLADEHDKQYPHEPRMRIQTHISENKEEVRLVRNLYGQSYAGVYDTRGLLRDTTILGHAVHLDKDEVKLIKSKNAGIAHCPTSNFYLTSGVAPIGMYLDHGVKVGLGTDVSGGYAVSMLIAIQNASIASKIYAMNPPPAPCKNTGDGFENHKLSVKTLFYLATLGGADVCNLSHKVGSFSRGKSFDALLVSALDDAGAINLWGKEAKSDNVLKPHKKEAEVKKDAKAKKEAEMKKLEENLERFLFCGDDRSILEVYVQGCLVGGRSFKK